MKIEIKNLGPIHHFEFDLEKDLHLLYGGNNVGKSFAVNVVYCVLKAVDYFAVNAFSNANAFMSWLELVQKEIKDSGNYVYLNQNFVENFINSDYLNVDLDYPIKGIFHEFVRETFVKNIENLLIANYENLQVLNNQFNPDNNFEINIDFNGLGTLCLKNYIPGTLGISSFDFIKSVTGQYKDGKDGNDYFEIEWLYKTGLSKRDIISVNEIDEEESLIHTGSFIFQQFLTLLKDVQKPIYFLPSSRSGLYAPLSGMGEILAKISNANSLLGMGAGFNIPTLPFAASQYYSQLTVINSEVVNPDFNKIVYKIEENIINGKIAFEQATKKIYFFPKKTDLKIHLTNTASMVAEIAPLILFLNHVIRFKKGTKTILIIEEPEAHLHPEIQVKLMEIFAELTKHNVKVILTSHSNYMFNKVSNMLLKGEIEPKKVGVYHMDMTEKGSVVRPDMQATEEGIEDHNFVDVAEDLYNERVEIYEKLNAQTNAAK